MIASVYYLIYIIYCYVETYEECKLVEAKRGLYMSIKD